MCFLWLKKIYHWLRRKCLCRNRGYSHEISSHHRGWRGGTIHGHGSFFCDREGSVTYSRGPSSFQPMPASSTYDISGGYSCSGDGSIVIRSSDSQGTPVWGISGGTVPFYGTRGAMGHSSEDSWRGGGSIHHSGIRYDASPRENAWTSYGGSGGPVYYSGGGYGTRGYAGPELSYEAGGSSQTTQQKCPVVIPSIKEQQKCPVVVPNIKGQQKSPMVIPSIKGQQESPVVVPHVEVQQSKTSDWPPSQK
ncbi:uncharacterized protein [Heliangelus exortis]|uniref:uncharacterized protein n=1 Tax=Heliangelus exortis TaxID=472823 RepID=UPI003A93B64E